MLLVIKCSWASVVSSNGRDATVIPIPQMRMLICLILSLFSVPEWRGQGTWERAA